MSANADSRHLSEGKEGDQVDAVKDDGGFFWCLLSLAFGLTGNVFAVLVFTADPVGPDWQAVIAGACLPFSLFFAALGGRRMERQSRAYRDECEANRREFEQHLARARRVGP